MSGTDFVVHCAIITTSTAIILSLLYAIWNDITQCSYGDIEENLTMEKNPIKITIENYCGQIVTFTMSSEAEIESSLCIENSIVTEVHINAYDKDILTSMHMIKIY